MNARIAWDFGAMHVGGGRTLGLDLLDGLAGEGSHRHLCIVDPRLVEGHIGRLPENIELAATSTSALQRLWRDQVRLQRLARRFRSDVFITLGNVGTWRAPMPLGIFIQTPYGAYSDAELRDARLTARTRASALLLREYLRPAIRSATGVAVQTEAMRRAIHRLWRVPADRVAILGGSVSSQFRAAADAEATAQPRAAATFLTLSDATSHKNIEYIVEVSARLMRRGVVALFEITLPPDGLDGMAIRRRARSAGVEEQLRLIGRLTINQVVQRLRTCTAVFLPSLLETLGLPYLEARYLGTPILASDRPFAREVCGDGAQYFDPLSPEDGERAVMELLATPPSPVVHRPRSAIPAFVAWAESLVNNTLSKERAT